MTKIATLLIACATVALATPASAAQYLFSFSGQYAADPDFSEAGTSFSGSGTLTTDDTPIDVGGGQFAYLVTGITGERNGAAIDALLPAGSLFAGSPTDNLLFTTPGYFDYLGVGYTVQGSASQYSLYSLGSGTTQEYIEGAPTYADLKFSLTAAAVPEPATWAMLITGFGMVGGAMRSRRRAPARAIA